MLADLLATFFSFLFACMSTQAKGERKSKEGQEGSFQDFSASWHFRLFLSPPLLYDFICNRIGLLALSQFSFSSMEREKGKCIKTFLIKELFHGFFFKGLVRVVGPLDMYAIIFHARTQDFLEAREGPTYFVSSQHWHDISKKVHWVCSSFWSMQPASSSIRRLPRSFSLSLSLCVSVNESDIQSSKKQVTPTNRPSLLSQLNYLSAGY